MIGVFFMKCKDAIKYYNPEPTLKECTPQNIISIVSKTKYKNGRYCPHCNSKHTVKNGTHNGIQRYKCKECNKTFCATSLTPLSKTHHLDKWSTFISCMINGYSLRKSSTIVGVSWVTLFYWRHKILTNLKQKTSKSFKNIVEIDDTYFTYSEKGNKHIINRVTRKRGKLHNHFGNDDNYVCVLNAIDSENRIVSKVACLGMIKKSRIEKIIGPCLSKDNILCTSNWREYKNFCKMREIKHYIITYNNFHIKYNIKKINSYIIRLKNWITKFNGVASKYLDNYVIWHKFLAGINFLNNKKNVLVFLVTSCMYSEMTTFDSLRLSQFSIN
jgi:transposase-like protein